MKTCVMPSHVHHSERGSVISDCLVNTVIHLSVRPVFDPSKPRRIANGRNEKPEERNMQRGREAAILPAA